ncbi:hypothetical protein QTN24_01455 [Cupriavidus sp. SZY C1]|uniref:hypothetical protein n=1 Tax=Cupriavidus sp. SZY C1 TaxID=3055037 RepID=UPI0028B7CB48|nr:hypothetical protein [Cupriavidus sp. SZY C1]MDT6960151.1 hypothetical protein [Cupriavidus sp. SZY C1]
MEWLAMMPTWWPNVRDWLEANEKLAGWAQAFGALIALVIAIGVPAWQRYAERRDAQISATNANSALAQSLYFLLRDIEIFLVAFVEPTGLPRRTLWDPVTMDDLLSRISALESREQVPERVTALYRARGALTGARVAFIAPINDPFSDAETNLMRTRVELLQQFASDANRWSHDAHYRRLIARKFLLARLIAPFVKIPVEFALDWWAKRKQKCE